MHHACMQDPSPNGVTVGSGVGVVLVEGLYLSVTKEPWGSSLKGLFDERWFIHTPM